jgi:hypothetical protein
MLIAGAILVLSAVLSVVLIAWVIGREGWSAVRGERFVGVILLVVVHFALGVWALIVGAK